MVSEDGSALPVVVVRASKILSFRQEYRLKFSTSM